MQLIQIGETGQKTIAELFFELADRQMSEIEQLKRSALERSENKRRRTRGTGCKTQGT